MRSAGSKTDFVFNEDGSLVGVCLAAAFCAEHECGISRIYHNFGIERDLDQFGVEPRRVTAVDNQNIVFLKRKTGKITRSLLYSEGGYSTRWFAEQYLGTPKTPIAKVAENLDCYPREDKITASWSESGFTIYAPNEELSLYLEEMYKAFIEGDAIVMCGGGGEGPFDKPGLVLGIISRMADNIKQNMYNADKDAYDLEKAAKATGIYDVVDRGRYFALSPRWRGKDSKKSRYSVIFWLNPCNQEENGFGYFTVEELTSWVKGEAPDGPIANRGNIWNKLQRAKKIADGRVDNLYRDEVCCVPCLSIINVRSPRSRTAQCGKCGDSENLVKPAPRI